MFEARRVLRVGSRFGGCCCCCVRLGGPRTRKADFVAVLDRRPPGAHVTVWLTCELKQEEALVLLSCLGLFVGCEGVACSRLAKAASLTSAIFLHPACLHLLLDEGLDC